MQHAMNRAAFSDVQKPGVLLIGKLTIEMDLPLNMV